MLVKRRIKKEDLKMTQTLEKKKYSIKTDFSLLSILLSPYRHRS